MIFQCFRILLQKHRGNPDKLCTQLCSLAKVLHSPKNLCSHLRFLAKLLCSPKKCSIRLQQHWNILYPTSQRFASKLKNTCKCFTPKITGIKSKKETSSHIQLLLFPTDVLTCLNVCTYISLTTETNETKPFSQAFDEQTNEGQQQQTISDVGFSCFKYYSASHICSKVSYLLHYGYCSFFALVTSVVLMYLCSRTVASSHSDTEVFGH